MTVELCSVGGCGCQVLNRKRRLCSRHYKQFWRHGEVSSPEDKAKLTDKQLALYVFMKDFFKENDQLPPLAAIKTQIGARFDNAAVELRLQLAKKGYIERNQVGKWRFSREGAMHV